MPIINGCTVIQGEYVPSSRLRVMVAEISGYQVYDVAGCDVVMATYN